MGKKNFYLDRTILGNKKLFFLLLVIIAIFFYILNNKFNSDICKYRAFPVKIPKELNESDIIFEEENLYFNDKIDYFSEFQCSLKDENLLGVINKEHTFGVTRSKEDFPYEFIEKNSKFKLKSAYNLKCNAGIKCIDSGDLGLVFVLVDENENNWVISHTKFRHSYYDSTLRTSNERLVSSYYLNEEKVGPFDPVQFFSKDDGILVFFE